MFQLTSEKSKLLEGQNIKYLPYAFTNGAIMAANVLNERRE